MRAPWKFGAQFPGGVCIDFERDERHELRALPEAEAARLVHVVLESFAPSAHADPRAAAAHLPEGAGNALLDLVSALPSELPLDIDRVLDAGASLERQLTREAVAWTLARAGAERVLDGLARRILGSSGEQRRRELTWLRDIARAMAAPPVYRGVGGGERAPKPRPLVSDGFRAGMARSRGPLDLSIEATIDESLDADIDEELDLIDEAEAPEDAAAPLPLPLGGPPVIAPPADAPSTAPAPRSAAAHHPSRPESLDASDPVDVAVFCPGEVARESSFLVQVFLYPPTSDAEVAAEAREADDSAQRRGRLTLPLDLPVGTRVDLRLEMPALGVLEPDAVVVWRGRSASAQFDVSVPAMAAIAQAIGRVRIAIAGTPTATLRFVVKVVAAGTAPRPAESRDLRARRYRNAFVSYSSEDRAEVLRRVQAFRIAGLSVFQDILDLKPGELWERALYRYIDECDVFLLFWSRAAAASPWVQKEIEYALARKADDHEGPPDIQPVPLEGPPLVPPPPGLRAVHFNDALLAHIQAADRAATAPRA
jgi:hypothetical protein